MFDSLWGSKFCNKCKHAVKSIRTRAVPITRKKQANIAYLKQVVANLLARGEEDEAFRRMDGLIVEINRTACYDVIQNFCELILSQLPELQKQRECSQEVLEAMATIIFAAARFADLPELCDLRRVFTERYGDHIESTINAEFVEKFETTTFSKEKKLQVMQNIADEFSVRWNKEFGRKQSNVPITIPDKPKKTELKHNRDEASPSVANELKGETALKQKKWPPADVILEQQRQIEPRDIHVITTKENCHSEEPRTIKEFADYKPENDEPYRSNKVISPYGYTKHRNYTKDELKDSQPREKLSEVQDGLGPTCCKSDKQGSQGKYSVDKPLNMVPPYMHKNVTTNKYVVEKVEQNGFAPHIKSDGSMNGYPVKGRSLGDLACEAAIQRHEEWTTEENEPVMPANDEGRVRYMTPPYVKPNFKGLSVQNDRRQKISDDADCETEVTYNMKEGAFGDEKPKPVSVRRKFPKPQDIPKDDSVINRENVNSHTPDGLMRHTSRTPGLYDDNDNKVKIPNRTRRSEIDDEIDNAIDFGKLLPRTSSDRRRHASSHTTTTKGDDEVFMDRLLVHYSTKGKAPEPGKERSRSKTHPRGHVANVDQVVEHQSDDSHTTYSAQEAMQVPGRSFSLLTKPTESAVSEAPTRSTSMRPDLSIPEGGRGHPRLPDYDQLAARLAALRRV